MYFEMLTTWYITESIIQPEPFPINFSIFDIVIQINSNISLVSLSLIIASTFALE